MMSAKQAQTVSRRQPRHAQPPSRRWPRVPAAAPLLSWLLLVSLACLFGGCAATPTDGRQPSRAFAFPQDTFAFANELVWEYGWDANGRWHGRPRVPEAQYSHRCFVLARATKQFFLQAQFHPDAPPVDDLTYRRLVRAILDSSPIKSGPDTVDIPGYRNLHEFSTEQASLLKAEAGGPWKSYFQRGHWRMIFPFTRGSQLKTAHRFLQTIRKGRPAVAHLVCFPSLRINHAVVVFAAEEQDQEILFQLYDPNTPNQPETLVFNRITRTFQFPPTDYFPGGPVDVYEVYRSLCY